MTFTPKAWEDEPDPLGVLQGRVSPTSRTPLDAAGIIDVERRLSAYADEQVAAAAAAGLRLGTTSSTALRGDARAADVGAAAASHTHTASAISDSTTTGRNVLTANDATAARSAIGAGTSSLALGTSSSTALRGDYSPPADQAAGTSSMRRLGSGTNEAAPGASALGFVVYDGDVSAARPTGHGAVLWIGFPTEPTNRTEPDLWLVPRATEPETPELVVVQQPAAGFATPAASAQLAWRSTPRAGNLLVAICSVDKAAGGSGPTPSNITTWPVLRQSSSTSISICATARLARGDADDTAPRFGWTNPQPAHIVLLELEWDGSTPSIRSALVTSESVVTSIDLAVTADGNGFAIAAYTIDTGTNWVRPHTWTGAARIVEIDDNATNDAPLDVAGVAVADGQAVAVRAAAAGGSAGDQAAGVIVTFGRP